MAAGGGEACFCHSALGQGGGESGGRGEAGGSGEVMKTGRGGGQGEGAGDRGVAPGSGRWGGRDEKDGGGHGREVGGEAGGGKEVRGGGVEGGGGSWRAGRVGAEGETSACGGNDTHTRYTTERPKQQSPGRRYEAVWRNITSTLVYDAN